MIGQLRFPAGRETVTATLDDDHVWLCDDPEWANVLNAQFPVSNLNGSSGRFALYRAAERLAGRVETPTKKQAV